MAEFGSVEPFGIDDGQIAEKTPQECFVLGYEMGSIVAKIESRCEIRGQLIHSDNRERIEEFGSRRGAVCRATWMPDDVSESWMLLNVEYERENV